jgi:GNAT superfamily N-acetyltransferase
VQENSAAVSLEKNANAADVAAVQAGLRAYNVEFIGDPGEEQVTVFLRNSAGEVVGGLLGHIKWHWLYVAKLWIADEYRGKGHGVELLESAEDYARSKNCIGSYLDTFEYQARPFYEKCGYELFGTLNGYPPGSSQFYLSKRL